MTTLHRRIDATEYTVGWICALPVELAASVAFLDELYLPPPLPWHDPNSYRFGRIGSHNVVLACLPSGVMGTSSAATVAAHVRSTFPTIQFGLLVGVGGGAPCSQVDIRLGDVVVSKPIAKSGGVIQYDFGKTIEKGKFIQTGSLNKPPAALLGALSNFEAECRLKGNSLSKAVLDVPEQHSALRSEAVYPGVEYDKLFKAEYDHEEGSEMCTSCNLQYVVDRPPRSSNDPLIHFGLIASGNQVMRNGVTRENLQRELGVLCFEMEAAGLMDSFPCLVVRGICDYADSHKNKKWQSYAAVTSAACAKKIVMFMPSTGANVITEEPQTTPLKPSFPLALENSFFRNPRNPRFSGRDTELSAIDKWRSQDTNSVHGQKPQLRMVVYGLGGVGKTQLITEWCYRMEKPVFWFTATSAEELKSQYQYQAQLIHDFAKTNKAVKLFLDNNNYIPGRDIDLVKAWIGNYEDWVLILDNYDVISVDIEPFIPASYGRVLFTSRDRRAVGTVSNHGLELKRPRSREAEILFLRQCIPGAEVVEEDLESIHEYSEIREIVSSLDGFPLALSQAGAYIRENQPCSYKHYLNLLRVNQDREILLRFKGVRPEYPESVLTTWEISMSFLEEKYPEATEVLQLLGFFAQSGVPEEILFTPTKQQVWRFGNCVATRELNREQQDRLKFLGSQAQCIIYLGILISLSLMSKSQDGVISVHPLVHEWIQIRLKPTPSESIRFAYLCSLIVHQAYPLEYFACDEFPGRLAVELRPHLAEIYRNLQQAGQTPNSIPLEVRTLLLADVLVEILNGNISLRGIHLPTLIATSTLETLSEEESLDAIQPKLFDIIRSTQLPSPDSLRQIMELIQSSVSIYTTAPQWKPSRRIYLVVLVTLILNLAEHCDSTPKSPGDEPISSLSSGPASWEHSFVPDCEMPIHEFRQSTILALRDLLHFLSLHTAEVPDEISFLKICTKVMLGRILTAQEYEGFPWQFVHDNLSLKQVACVHLSTVITYSATCVRFSRSSPQHITHAIQLSTDALQKWWEEESTKAIKRAAAGPSRFLSSSFGRDVSFFTAIDIRLDFEKELWALQNESLQCIETLLHPVLKSGTEGSLVGRPQQRAIGTSMVNLLNVLEDLQTTLKILRDQVTNVPLINRDNRITQDYRMNRLLAYANFLTGDHRYAIGILQKIFHADQVITALNVENRDPRHFLTRVADYRTQNDEQLSGSFQVGYGYSLPGVGLSSLRQFLPFPLALNTNGPRQDYSSTLHETQYPTIDFNEFKDLLRLWIACLKDHWLADTDQIRKWQEDCDAISNRDSLDSLVLIYTLAERSKLGVLPESKFLLSEEQPKVKTKAYSEKLGRMNQQEVKKEGGLLNCSLM